MEIELKYRIPTQEVADDIWKDKLFLLRKKRGQEKKPASMPDISTRRILILQKMIWRTE